MFVVSRKLGVQGERARADLIRLSDHRNGDPDRKQLAREVLKYIENLELLIYSNAIGTEE